MRGKGRIVTSFAAVLLCFLLSLSFGAAATASAQIEYEENFLRCSVTVDGEFEQPVPIYTWSGRNGIILGENDPLLGREFFVRDEVIKCIYRDSANDVETSATFTVPNAPPVLEAMEDRTLRQGKILTLVPKVQDLDDDNVTLTYSSPFNAAGTWSNTQDYDAGDYDITVTATDEIGATDTVSFTVELVDIYAGSRESIKEKIEENQLRLAQREFEESRTAQTKLIDVNKNQRFSYNVKREQIALTQANFTSKYAAAEIDITVKASEDMSVGFNATAYKRVDFSHTQGVLDFKDVVITFAVSKDFYEDYSIILVYENLNGWKGQQAKAAGETDDAMLFTATLESLNDFIIAGRVLPVQENTKEDTAASASPLTSSAVSVDNNDDDESGSNWWIVMLLGLVVAGVAASYLYMNEEKRMGLTQRYFGKRQENDTLSHAPKVSQDEIQATIRRAAERAKVNVDMPDDDDRVMPDKREKAKMTFFGGSKKDASTTKGDDYVDISLINKMLDKEEQAAASADSSDTDTHAATRLALQEMHTESSSHAQQKSTASTATPTSTQRQAFSSSVTGKKDTTGTLSLYKEGLQLIKDGKLHHARKIILDLSKKARLQTSPDKRDDIYEQVDELRRRVMVAIKHKMK